MSSPSRGAKPGCTIARDGPSLPRWEAEADAVPDKEPSLSRSARRISVLLLLLLAVAVAAPPAFAGDDDSARVARRVHSLFSSIRQTLGEIVSRFALGSTGDSDGRQSIDPNGATAPAGDPDGRWTLDPNG